MSRDPAVLLEDVAQAASEIAGFIEGLEFEVFDHDTRTQRAVERNLEIIGEALNRLSRISPGWPHEFRNCGRLSIFVISWLTATTL